MESSMYYEEVGYQFQDRHQGRERPLWREPVYGPAGDLAEPQAVPVPLPLQSAPQQQQKRRNRPLSQAQRAAAHSARRMGPTKAAPPASAPASSATATTTASTDSHGNGYSLALPTSSCSKATLPVYPWLTPSPLSDHEVQNYPHHDGHHQSAYYAATGTTDTASSNTLDHAAAPWYLPSDDTILEALTPYDSFTFDPCGEDGSGHNWKLDGDHVDYVRPSRPWSTISSASAVSSTGSTLSTIHTEIMSESGTVQTLQSTASREPSPLRKRTIPLPSAPVADRDLSADAGGSSSTPTTTFRCDWAGCDSGNKQQFETHEAMVWHVKAEHLLVCPASGCTEGPFGSSRMVETHVTVAHPAARSGMVKEWQLESDHDSLKPGKAKEDDCGDKSVVQNQQKQGPSAAATFVGEVPKKRKLGDDVDQAVARKKRDCQAKLQQIVEKRAKRERKSSSGNSPTPHHFDGHPLQSSPSYRVAIRSPQAKSLDTLSFPLVWEHAVLPFLIEFIPKWSTPRHIISTTRGRTPDLRRVNITTQTKMPHWRKLIVAKHVRDILPPKYRDKVSFVFSVGDVVRLGTTWARGLSKDHPDDICMPKNPYMYNKPCMGDSIGISGGEEFTDSTATLGPCITIGGGSYWLGNFHPFLEAYRSHPKVRVEHPSPQDRARCIQEAHDVMEADDDFRIGQITVTSGLNLKTTRVSHEPYWDDCEMEPPLVVTDWALISANSSRGNALRRFPADTQPLAQDPLICDTSAVTPGASVISSGRTSGQQRGQVCEIPAYVSGEENGTLRATREWFIEEPCPGDNEESWIRSGIGVEGDSGAAVVDADSSALVGQIWGRNRYWGPGPRLTYFTPIADVFDDIQEKCGQQRRPQLPQHADEADRFAVYPSCRQCYDLRTYLDSRRSSRMSLQSMIMGRGDSGDQDLTSIEAASELATPRDSFPARGIGVEEAGASFDNVFSPGQVAYAAAGTPLIADMRSPYAQTLDLDEVVMPKTKSAPSPGTVRKRGIATAVPLPRSTSDIKSRRWKRQKVAE